jgi:hypothetical protein
VSWSNDRGGSGVATGTTSWSVTGITLQSGANVITVTARDAAKPHDHRFADGDIHGLGYHRPSGLHHDADIACDVHHEHDAQ